MCKKQQYTFEEQTGKNQVENLKYFKIIVKTQQNQQR